MAITKVSQLVQIKNSNAVLALTNRSFDIHGNILNSEDLLELSVRRKTVGQSGLNTNYYSFSSSIADLQFAIAGKLYCVGSNEPAEALTPALMYNKQFGARYKEGDRILHIGTDGNTYIICRTNQGVSADAPRDTTTDTPGTIAPAGTPDALLANTHYWKYESSDFSRHMIPLFSQIQTAGKIINGYWAESIPFEPINGITYNGAFEVLENIVSNNEYLTAYTTENNQRVGEIQRVDSDKLTLKFVIEHSDLSSYYNKAALGAIEAATDSSKLLAIYDQSSDRYILSAAPEIQNLPDILFSISKVFGTRSAVANNKITTANNIYFPFFVLHKYTRNNAAVADLYLPYAPQYVNNVYSNNVINSLNLQNYLPREVVLGNGTEDTPIGIKSHLYYFLGNNFYGESNKDEVYISVLNAAASINNKENILESNTLEIDRNYIESTNVFAEGDSRPITKINLNIANPNNTPLRLDNFEEGLKFNFGESLACLSNKLHFNTSVDRKIINPGLLKGETVYELNFSMHVKSVCKKNAYDDKIDFIGVICPYLNENAGDRMFNFIACHTHPNKGQIIAYGTMHGAYIDQITVVVDNTKFGETSTEDNNSYAFEYYVLDQGTTAYNIYTYANGIYTSNQRGSRTNIIGNSIRTYTNSNVANNFSAPLVKSIYIAYANIFAQMLGARRSIHDIKTFVEDKVAELNTRVDEVENLVRYNNNRLHTILYDANNLPLN